MDNQENIMNEVLTRLTRIETKIDSVKPQLDDHEMRIRELEGRSGKRWDAITLSVVTAAVVGIVGFVLGKLL